MGCHQVTARHVVAAGHQAAAAGLGAAAGCNFTGIAGGHEVAGGQVGMAAASHEVDGGPRVVAARVARLIAQPVGRHYGRDSRAVPMRYPIRTLERIRISIAPMDAHGKSQYVRSARFIFPQL